MLRFAAHRKFWWITKYIFHFQIWNFPDNYGFAQLVGHISVGRIWKMRAQLVFDNKVESKKSYLTRMARLLDVIRNRPEEICGYPQIAGISPDEVREFENYLCKIIEPEVKRYHTSRSTSRIIVHITKQYSHACCILFSILLVLTFPMLCIV